MKKRYASAIFAGIAAATVAYCAQANEMQLYGGWVDAVKGPGSAHGSLKCLVGYGTDVSALAETDGYVLLRVNDSGLGTGCQAGTLIMMPREDLDASISKFNEAEVERQKRNEIKAKLFDKAGLDSSIFRALDWVKRCDNRCD